VVFVGFCGGRLSINKFSFVPQWTGLCLSRDCVVRYPLASGAVDSCFFELRFSVASNFCLSRSMAPCSEHYLLLSRERVRPIGALGFLKYVPGCPKRSIADRRADQQVGAMVQYSYPTP